MYIGDATFQGGGVVSGDADGVYVRPIKNGDYQIVILGHREFSTGEYIEALENYAHKRFRLLVGRILTDLANPNREAYSIELTPRA